MKLHELRPAPGSIKKRKRIGRGQGSGKGGTSTRGHNGAKSRSGYKSKRGFEGGQTPLQRRIPTFGFKSPNRVAYKPVNLDLLQNLIEKTSAQLLDSKLLQAHGIVRKRGKYKVLGKGTLNSKVEVVAHAFSASAIKAIETAGGQATILK